MDTIHLLIYQRRNALHYQHNLYITEVHLVGYNSVGDITGLSLFI